MQQLWHMGGCKDEAVVAGKGASSEETRHLHSQSDFQGEGKISKAEEKRRDNELRSKARPFSCIQICDSELSSVDYKQVILSRWELPAAAKKSLVAVLDDYVGKEATRFDLH